ncbi:MAG: endonuclease/exonuclease/phosphatase family protein [Bacteroidales bacterium]|jgi:endonuclease/exonuclease/phosphatase family metal-dependent hydrolase|nr:endonuclease/exonuclease/phosphatase family protein [Bacteroidales bacterium]
MSKEKLSFIRLLFLILNTIAVLGLISAYLANFLNPATYFFAALSGLFYPYMLAVNGFFVVFWLFRKWKYALFSLVTILIGVDSLHRFYQFSGEDIPSGNDSLVKVLSYNVQVFGIYSDKNNKQDILDFLEKEQPDIACFQEYCQNNKPENNISTASQIEKAIDANSHYLYLPLSRGKYQFGMAIFSRFPIINKGNIVFNDAKANHAMYADMLIENDTVRVYNIHFQSIHFGAEDYLFARQATSNAEMSNSKWKQNSMRILRKIKSGFAKRTEQVNAVVEHIKSSPHRVIICGDFNDTPWSYTYRQIRNLSEDSFIESGKGTGYTFIIRKLLAFRIDYIFHDKSFKSYQYTTTAIHASDHYPIHTCLQIK